MIDAAIAIGMALIVGAVFSAFLGCRHSWSVRVRRGRGSYWVCDKCGAGRFVDEEYTGPR